MEPCILGIDPGTDGGAVALHPVTLKVMRTISIKFDKAWQRDLFSFIQGEITDYDGVHVVLERVHSMTGNGAKSAWTFAENYGSIKTVLYLAGVASHNVFMQEPATWPMIIGLPKHRNVIDPRKRREARRVSQEAWAREIFPCLKDWDAKKQGDIFAAALLAYTHHRRRFTVSQNVERAQEINAAIASSLPR